MSFLSEHVDEIERKAKAQAAAYAQMLEIGEGIGALALAHPELYDAMREWDDATENEHADTVLALVKAARESAARALREAAAEMERIWVHERRSLDMAADTWLHQRADRIERGES